MTTSTTTTTISATTRFTFATVIAILVVIGFVYLLVRPYKEDNRLNIDLNKTVTEK